MCKGNGLNHTALDARTPCVCIRKASFRETNMPTLGAEMPKNAVWKHSSVMRNGAFGTMEEPFPHGDKASSAWRSGEDDARRQCYGVSDVAVPFYFVNVNCQNKIKLLFILIVPSAVSWRAIPIMPCRLPSGACRLTPPLSAVIAPADVFIRINSVNVRAKRLCGYL